MARTPQTVAAQLRKVIESSGLSFEKMAKKLGTNKGTVYHFVKKGRDPQLSTVEAWAKKLGFRLELIKESRDDS